MELQKNETYQRFTYSGKFEDPRQRIGVWGWIGLYLTGALLLFFLLAHILLVHYGTAHPLSYQSSARALGSAFVRTVELGLLFFAVIHGLIGLRRFLLDLEIFSQRGSLYLTRTVTALGSLLLIWGSLIFMRLAPG